MSGHHHGDGAELSYTEQLLHMLDEFDTDELHVVYNSTDLWKVQLKRSVGRGPVAWVRMMYDGYYGWGTTTAAGQAHGTAEETLERVKQHMLALDGAARLGGG